MRPTSIKLIVIVLFILSGICGLIYEVVWSKYLSLFIGNTGYSIMIVLATFMGGLALGSYYWGKYADLSPNRLKLYGMLELAIGIYCLFYPVIIGICEKIFVAAATGLNAASDQVVLLLLKFLLSFTTLIIPTFFMGGTLPVLTKYLTRTIRDTGKGVAILYYINSAGAVIGAGLAGFFLIRLYSLDGAVVIAAVLNLCVGSVALFMSTKTSNEFVPEIQSIKSTPKPIESFSHLRIRLAILTAACSGFIAMIYELTWMRLLSNILGSSTYSFSLMLIAFISGITLGSWIVSLIIGRIKNLTSFLGLCQLGTAISMIGTLPFYERLPYYLFRLSTYFSNTPSHFPYFLFCEFFFCLLIMIIPTTLSGMSLPIASRIASNDIRLLGKSVGGIFSINTIGTVVGALATGLLFMPQLGVKTTIELGVSINILLGFFILHYDGSLSRYWRIGIAVFIVVISIGYRLEFPTWDRSVTITGIFRCLFQDHFNSFDDLKSRFSAGLKILWYKEGMNANVAVTEGAFKDGYQKTLFINGKADASTASDLGTQILLAQIPLMIVPDDGDALVIGLGSGITCGSALQHPIHSLDCVELCSEVVECNSFFENENNHFMQDPRVKIYIDDAITYLKVTSQKYDYIMSEPTNPWIAGVGNLFTREFFSLTKSHLRQGGVLAQWFHTYDMNDDIFKLIMRTLSESFQFVSIWRTLPYDVVILASDNPIPLDRNLLDTKFGRASIRGELARIKILDVPTLLSTQLTSHMNPPELFGEGDVNTEKKPLLEYLAPLSFFIHASVTMIDSLDERIIPSGGPLFWDQYAGKRKLTAENYFNIASFRYLTGTGSNRMTYVILKKYLAMNPDNVNALMLLSKLDQVFGIADEYLTVLRKLFVLQPENKEFKLYYTEALQQRMFEESSIRDTQDVRYILKMAASFSDSGYYGDAAKIFQKVIDLFQKGKFDLAKGMEENLSIAAARNFLLAKDIENAELFLNMVRKMNPKNRELPELTGQITLQKNRASGQDINR
ncbi:MAG: fused MFS/spermidine synthase [Bacteroidota bacterium]